MHLQRGCSLFMPFWLFMAATATLLVASCASLSESAVCVVGCGPWDWISSASRALAICC